MGVVKGIKHLAPLAFADDKPEMPENSQLMRDSRLLHPDGHRQLAYRAGAVAKPREDADAARSRERLHRLGDLARCLDIDDDVLRLVLDPVAHARTLHVRMFIRAGLRHRDRRQGRPADSVTRSWSYGAVLRGPASVAPYLDLARAAERDELAGGGRHRTVCSDARGDRPDREREDARKKAVAKHAVFAGALDERQKRDQERNRTD